MTSFWVKKARKTGEGWEGWTLNLFSHRFNCLKADAKRPSFHSNGMFPVNVHAWSPVLKNAAGRRRYLPMSALVPMASAARAKWSGCEATVVRTSFRKAEMTFAFKILSELYHDHNLHWFISLACHLVYIITTDMKWIHGSFSIHMSMQSKKTSRNDKLRRYGHLEMCVFWSCRIHLECMVTWCWSGTSAAEKNSRNPWVKLPRIS